MKLVVGVGNPDRGDDAAGLTAVRLVAAAAPAGVTVTELSGDQLGLLDAWAGADDVDVVDAVCSGGTPGTVHRLDAAAPLGGCFAHRGTHAFSLTDVVELARALGRLPARLVCHGIEGAEFGLGAPLSAAAEAGARAAAGQILRELKADGSN